MQGEVCAFMLTKQEIVAALKSKLEPTSSVRAATLGGSDANRRADEMSDVDLFVIVEKGEIESTAAAIDEALLRLSPIRHKLRLPMPTWHGFEQAFYQLERAPEHLMVDWVIVEKGPDGRAVHPWFEVERHGVHRVLFDKDGLVREARADMDKLRASAAKRVEELRVKFRVFRHLPAKLAKRGLPADGAYFYHGMVLRGLVDMARAVHCVERWDFGFRYLKDDLPGELYGTICELSYPPGVEALPGFVERVSGEFEKLLSEWDKRK